MEQKPIQDAPKDAIQNRPKKNVALKKKAQQSIRVDASPVPLSKYFSSFLPDLRGDILVHLNRYIPERYASHLIPLIRNFNSIEFLFPGESEAVLTCLRIISAGLNAAVALKLLFSIPQTELVHVMDLQHLSNMSVHVPTGFAPVLALIGKTDYNDSVIRVKNSPYLVRLHLLKMIWLALKTQSFQSSSASMSQWYTLAQNLKRLSQRDLEFILFDDSTTVQVLREKGRSELERLLKSRYEVVIEDRTYYISPAYISLKSNKAQFLEWIQGLHPAVDQENLTTLGLITIFQSSWLKKRTQTLADIDPAFADTVVADVTPQMVLDTVGIYYYGQYFPKAVNFVEACLHCITWYNNETVNLQRIGSFIEPTKSSFGHVAQLVTLDDREVEKFQNPYLLSSFKDDDLTPDGFMDILVPVQTATLVYSTKKITTPGEILTAASFMITDSIETREKFRGFTTRALPSIGSEIVRSKFGSAEKKQ